MLKFLYERLLSPFVSEIPEFLTGEECEGIINRTRKQGLFTSHVHIDPESREYEKKTKELIGKFLSSYSSLFTKTL